MTTDRIPQERANHTPGEWTIGAEWGSESPKPGDVIHHATGQEGELSCSPPPQQPLVEKIDGGWRIDGSCYFMGRAEDHLKANQEGGTK